MSNTSGSGFGLASDAAGQARRSPMEMVCDILSVVSVGPTKPTHILYKANMSWKVLSAYLDYLTSSGMLDKSDQEGGKRSTYALTLKGRNILRLYEGLKGSLNGTLSLEESDGLKHLVEGAKAIGPRASVSAW